MGVSAAALSDDIDKALRRVTDLFTQQCAHGAQTDQLPNEFAACGQFIGDEAAGNAQRGLHGIAAALRVLGPATSAHSRDLVGRLVAFCEAAFGLRGHVGAIGVQRDSRENVIKLGELLYAVSFVAAAQVDTGPLVRHLKELLLNSLVRNRGWGYFIRDTSPEVLPTAYAIRGLAQVGVEVSSARQFVLDALRTRSTPTPATTADVTTTIACAYLLTFHRSAAQDPEIKVAFSSAWRVIEATFGEDLEQNLEYTRGDENHYVRVPMQLYGLALVSEYSALRFATFRTQRRFKAIVEAIQRGAFAYPYSGRLLSSRTHAIAFDVLTSIKESLRHAPLLAAAYALDRIRTFLGSRWFRIPAAAVALGLIVYSVIAWSRSGKVEDLGPDLVAGLLVVLMSLARK